MLNLLMVDDHYYSSNKLMAKLSTPARDLRKQCHRLSLTFQRNQGTEAVAFS